MGNHICLKEVDNGVRKKYKVEYAPTLYVPGNSKSKFKTLEGAPAEPMKFGSIKECREFLKMHEGVPDWQVYGNTQYQYAFISDEYPGKEVEYDLSQISIVTMDIETESEAGFTQDAAQTADERINVITLKDFRKDEYHVFTFVDGGIYNAENKFVAKTKNVKHYEYDSERDMLTGFLKVWRKLDPDILTGWFVRFFDVPYIYNRLVKLFDESTAKKLSPWGMVQPVTVNFMNHDRECFDIAGCATLDYVHIYKKNIMDPRENYKLDYIAKVELGEGKVDWREKFDTMKEFYTKDFQWFVEYNIQDVKLPDMLEAKLKLIELTVSVAYIAKVNYIDVLAQTRTWDMLIYNWLREENIVIPQKEFQEKTEQFIGAYIKEPNPGRFDNIVSFDVASLYPNIIRALNIGPDTKRGDLYSALHATDVLAGNDKWAERVAIAEENDCTLASNGVMYMKDRLSFYSRMVETLFTNRKLFQGEIRKAKKEAEGCTDPARKAELANIISKFDVKQKSTKIMMNSLYGAFGNQFFRFYDLHNAVAVTMTGQFIIQYIQHGLNRFMNKLFKTENLDFVVYSDTDSVYVSLDRLVQHVFKGKTPEIEKLVKFMDTVCREKLEPEIDRLFGELNGNYINGMVAEKPILSMKREAIADRGIWSSKKHYILRLWNSEGDNYFACNDCSNKFMGPSDVAPPCNKCKSANTKRISKLYIKGFDMIKSSLPQFTKDAMKKAVDIVMGGTQDELADFIAETRAKFMELTVEEVAFPRGVNNLEKYASTDDGDTYVKGTPKAVKGVLLYNECLVKFGLQGKYQPIASSEKIKFVHLKEPNPIRDTVIAFNGKLPPEFGLHKFIDYSDMFEGTLVKPLEKILEPIGWSSEKTYDADQFFV